MSLTLKSSLATLELLMQGKQQSHFIPISERFSPSNNKKEKVHHLISPVFSSWILWVFFSISTVAS
ncbi:hypothetical protein KY290_008672 [Solanum tuberosum]|uniref:Uncharacterized protein n=1 Tax=Solanum tuberosum TaxID=4113 RepID=A0ABQ7W932_SOLTU|nr:hypothetical protein KY290_008672 [Solanum tuberosum]